MSNARQNAENDTMLAAAEWYWLIREADVTQEQLDEWQRWLTDSSAHRQAFERIEKSMETVPWIDSPPWPTEEELLEDRYDGSMPVSEWLTSGGDRRRPRPVPEAGEKSRPGRTFTWAIAASVAAIAVVAVGVINGIGSGPGVPEVAVYQTAPAEHRDVMLPDGSSISLGASTSVAVAYDRDARTVELQQGEAYFDVASDSDRPFQVLASERRITAVGTAFNVARQGLRVTLTVTEGEVVLDRRPGAPGGASAAVGDAGAAADQTARLAAGQRIVFDAREVAPISFADADDALAWRSGVLKYRGEKLRYVIEDVNRYTRRPIRIVDEAAAELSFTGTVFQDGAETWVYGLEDAFPVTVERSPDGVRIHSRPSR